MQNNFQIFFIFIFMSSLIFALDAKVNVYVQPHVSVYTSQKVTVNVELMSDAFSITDAKISFPSSKDYIVQAPKSAAYLRTVDVNGSDWQMVLYEYEVYALKAGDIRIDAMEISFSASMGYGQAKENFILKSEPLNFPVKNPKGVKPNTFVLVTDKYTISTKGIDKNKTLIMGDAVNFSVTQKAKNVPDILLKPIVYKSNAHLSVYDKEPELRNELKDSYDVSRTDSFTFVANAEGNVTVAQKQVTWWNSKTKSLVHESIPALHFEIIADPQIAIDAKKAQQKQIFLYMTIVFLVLLSMYAIFASKIRKYRQERKHMYAQSEAGRFALLLIYIKGNDVSAMYTYFYLWLGVISPMLSRGGFAALVKKQPSFEKSVKELEEKMLDSTEELDSVYFTQELRKLRGTLLAEKKGERHGLPENINPN